MRVTFGTNDPNDNNPYNENHIMLTSEQGGTKGENFPNEVIGLKGIYTLITPDNTYNVSGHADIMYNGKCPFGCFFHLSIERIDIWILH